MNLLFNTAAIGDEESVGRAIKESGVPRSEIFITTKLAYVFFCGPRHLFLIKQQEH